MPESLANAALWTLNVANTARIQAAISLLILISTPMFTQFSSKKESC
jgi:hypothetical protein